MAANSLGFFKNTLHKGININGLVVRFSAFLKTSVAYDVPVLNAGTKLGGWLVCWLVGWLIGLLGSFIVYSVHSTAQYDTVQCITEYSSTEPFYTKLLHCTALYCTVL